MNRSASTTLALLLGLALAGPVMVAPSAIAATVTASLDASAALVDQGETVVFTSRVWGTRPSDLVVVARRTGSTWTEVARDQVAQQSELRFEITPPVLGTNVYRITATRGSRVVSTSRSVSVDVLPAARTSRTSPRGRVEVRGTLPTATARPAILQATVDGDWQTVDTDLSTAAGRVQFSWRPAQTMQVRIVAPARSIDGVVYPRFVSPTQYVWVGRTAAPPTSSRLVGPFAVGARISGDGRHLLYTSEASVADDQQSYSSYLYAEGGDSRRVVPEVGDPSSTYANGVSADGHYVLLQARLSPADRYPVETALLVWDTESDEVTQLLSSTQDPDFVHDAVISDDGSTIAFSSTQDSLTPGDTNGVADAYVLDRVSRSVRRISDLSGETADQQVSQVAAISAAGSNVLYATASTSATPGRYGLHRWDESSGRSTAIPAPGAGGSPATPATLSADGRFVGYRVSTGMNSGASYVWDSSTGDLERAPMPGEVPTFNYAVIMDLSSDGRFALLGTSSFLFRWDRRTDGLLEVRDGPLVSASRVATMSDDGSVITFDSVPSDGPYENGTIYRWTTRG